MAGFDTEVLVLVVFILPPTSGPGQNCHSSSSSSSLSLLCPVLRFQMVGVGIVRGSYGAGGECTVWIPSFPQCELWYRRGASGSCFLPGHMCMREREAVPSRCWLFSGVTSATNELPPLRSHLCLGWSALNNRSLLGGRTRAQLLPWAGTTLKGPSQPHNSLWALLSLCCGCVTVQSLPPPSPASLTPEMDTAASAIQELAPHLHPGPLDINLTERWTRPLMTITTGATEQDHSAISSEQNMSTVQTTKIPNILLY